MWSILHWIFLYRINPNPVMHIIASLTLSAISYINKSKYSRRDILPAISLFLMYTAFYIDPNLEHLAFQPWWCVSIIGLRFNEGLIFIGGVMVGLYLLLVNQNPTAHILFNISQLIKRSEKMSFKSRALVHLLCMTIHFNDSKLNDVQYKDALAGLSAMMCAFTAISEDWFSLAMVFTSSVSIMTFPLHAMNLNWYKMYRNNHYRRVKNSYYFIYTIAVCLLAYGVDYHQIVSVFSPSSP